MRGVDLTSDEMVTLMQEARSANPVDIGWGSGRLLNTPGNAWAFYRLGQLRRVTEAGEG